MPKIAFIGAGSYGFTRRLVGDLLTYDAMRDAELSFMDIDAERLGRAETVITTLLQNEDLDTDRPLFTLDRDKTLEGADFVINIVKIGMLPPSFMDIDLPKEYGLKQTIGDTSCVAGVFRGLRTIPWATQLCRDIEQLCPAHAVVINYTNPQAPLVMACSRTSRVPFIGLCHSVQGTTRAIAKYLDVPCGAMAFEAAGINHMSWITKLEHKGQDLYPKLRQLVRERGIYNQTDGKDDSVQPFLGPTRLDMLNRIGYAVTESSTHFAEYVPYYARTDELIDTYRVSVDQYKRNMENKAKKAEEFYLKAQRNELPAVERSVEYGCRIINAMLTNEPDCIYANVMNDGLVTNLPEFAAVEVASLVDRNGVHPCRFGELPTVCAGLCSMEIAVHQLAVEAVLERDRSKVYHALMMDPLTHSVMTLDDMKELADTLIDDQQEWLGEVFPSA